VSIHQDGVAKTFTALPPNVPATQAGLYRENHQRIIHYLHTAMLTTSDLGGGVHPVNKSGYGAHAARVLGLVHGPATS
jgi:sialate O-acetylesterase